MIGPSGFMQAPKQQEEEKSIAFKSGEAAKKQGRKLEETGIRNLRIGSKQYDDFIAGYDSVL